MSLGLLLALSMASSAPGEGPVTGGVAALKLTVPPLTVSGCVPRFVIGVLKLTVLPLMTVPPVTL